MSLNLALVTSHSLSTPRLRGNENENLTGDLLRYNLQKTRAEKLVGGFWESEL